MRKKRKGSETCEPSKRQEIVTQNCEFHSSLSIRGFHFSLEDYVRSKKKRCQGDVNGEDFGSCKIRLKGIAATAPPCGSSSNAPPGRGLKRKIGCVNPATQMDRKKKIEDEYTLSKIIGRGKFGSVCLCIFRETGAEFACKSLRKEEETVHREVEIMQHLSGHPGIVTLQAVCEDSECFHLVMEYCSGGRLVDQMAKEGQYSENRAANIFKDLMLVIKYCHDMGVVHRDIKPENILLTTSGKIKLADFGLSVRVSNGQKLSGLAGSPAYVAPEVLSGDYSEKVDIWSAGVLLYGLLVGVLPFQGNSLESVFEAIKNVKLDFNTGIWESVSKHARDLVERMLTRDVSSRISADEVLRHPWILFYTERTLKTLSIKSKTRSQLAVACDNPVAAPTEPRNGRNRGFISSGLSLDGSSGNSTSKSEEVDDSGLVDALTVAVAHVRISEPKRARPCSPSNPIQDQCSSNNLCKAF